MQNDLPPVVLIFFNRPELLKQVFQRVAAAKPATLMLIADGPRKDREHDAVNCALAREVVARIDWECKIFRNYSDVNLGCGIRVSSGLNWVFEHVEEAIILEDDCVPHPSFFTVATSLLQYYRNQAQVMMISGNNFQPDGTRYEGSHYFSRYTHVWGWATWRRAWKLYDYEMREWPQLRAGGWVQKYCDDPIEANYWIAHFDEVFKKQVDTWDYQWLFACWRHGGLSAVPAVNLVTNIGAWHDATHGTKHSPNSDRPTFPLGPIVHPSEIKRDEALDTYEFERTFDGKSIRRLHRPHYRLRWMIGSALRQIGLRR